MKEMWYFYADWCPYCQKQNPIMDEFEQQHPEISIIRINEAEHRDAVEHNNVSGFPSMVIFPGHGDPQLISGLKEIPELEELFS